MQARAQSSRSGPRRRRNDVQPRRAKYHGLCWVQGILPRSTRGSAPFCWIVHSRQIRQGLSVALGREVEEYHWRCAPNSDLRQLGTGHRHGTLCIAYDGTGILVLERETRGRTGKGENEKAGTREIKVGCVFRQTRVNDDGYAVRDESSTSYIASCEPSDNFQWRIAHHAQVRGLDRAHRVCVLGDDASWIWTIADEQFPGAHQIVDLYHARQHYIEVGKMFYQPVEEIIILNRIDP